MLNGIGDTTTEFSETQSKPETKAAEPQKAAEQKPTSSNWAAEQAEIEANTKLSPEEKEKAKVESTEKFLREHEKQTEDLSTALIVAEGGLKPSDLRKSDIRDIFIPIIKELLKENKFIGQSHIGQLSEAKSDAISRGVSEAYHKAKADGTNPELVKAVEGILGGSEAKAVSETQSKPGQHKATIRITNANTRYEDDKEISESYNKNLSVLNSPTASKEEKTKALDYINNLIKEQGDYFREQLAAKLKGVDVKVDVVNTNGYWGGVSEHSFEVSINAANREEYFKALGRLADFSSEQSQDAFIEVKELTEEDVNEFKKQGIEALNDKMEDGSTITTEIITTFDKPLSVAEIALLSKHLSDNGFDSFTGGADKFNIIYFGESDDGAYREWATKLNNTLKQYFNGQTNNFSNGSHRIRTWYQAADPTETRGRTYREVKNNLQKRYSEGEGFGNKRASDSGNDGKKGNNKGGSLEDNGKSILEENHSEETQQFFTDVQNGKHRPNKPLEFILPLTNTLKRIHGVWEKFKGFFDEHIETNIPAFRDVQLRKIDAILNFLPKGGRIIDLGGSTGSFVKTITQLNPKIKSENLEPNDAMIQGHNKNPVIGSDPVRAAFLDEFADYEAYKPEHKFDVVHESMLFQFITSERKQFVDEIADNYLKDDGVVILEEKVIGKGYDVNEDKKDKDFNSTLSNS